MKKYFTYNVPKWDNNSNVDNEEINICSINAKDCSEDILFLYNYLKDKDLISY